MISELTEDEMEELAGTLGERGYPGGTKALAWQARDWLAKCEWADLDEAGTRQLTDAQALSGVDREFEGGLEEFISLGLIPVGEPGAWQADGTGIQPGGDVGDIQVGESYSVRYRRADRPFAMITRTAYPVEYRECPGEFAVQIQTEWLVCGEPLDPGGTEIWSDYEYDDEIEIHDSAADAEKAALQVATELLGDGGAHGWDGLPPWESGQDAPEET